MTLLEQTNQQSSIATFYFSELANDIQNKYLLLSELTPVELDDLMADLRIDSLSNESGETEIQLLPELIDLRSNVAMGTPSNQPGENWSIDFERVTIGDTMIIHDDINSLALIDFTGPVSICCYSIKFYLSLIFTS